MPRRFAPRNDMQKLAMCLRTQVRITCRDMAGFCVCNYASPSKSPPVHEFAQSMTEWRNHHEYLPILNYYWKRLAYLGRRAAGNTIEHLMDRLRSNGVAQTDPLFRRLGPLERSVPGHHPGRPSGGGYLKRPVWQFARLPLQHGGLLQPRIPCCCSLRSPNTAAPWPMPWPGPRPWAQKSWPANWPCPGYRRRGRHHHAGGHLLRPGAGSVGSRRIQGGHSGSVPPAPGGFWRKPGRSPPDHCRAGSPAENPGGNLRPLYPSAAEYRPGGFHRPNLRPQRQA